MDLPLLNNPQKLQFNAYVDKNPKGFGLLQLDRDFSHYQDIMGTDINLVALKIAHLNELGYGFRNVDHRSDFLR